MSKRKGAPALRKTTFGEFVVTCCADGHIHIDLTHGEDKVSLMFEPDDAYTFAEAIMRGYDEAVGIR